MSEKMKFPENKKPFLTFEQFLCCNPDDEIGLPTYNNFYFFFSEGDFGEIYRAKECYLKFAEQYPEKAANLRDKIQNMDQSISRLETLKPFEADLYDAYKIMRQYVSSDWDLFA